MTHNDPSGDGRAAAFPALDVESAPDGSAAILSALHKRYGTIPNLDRALAASPQVLGAYSQMAAGFAGSGLSPEQQAVVSLVVSGQNECRYCIDWHQRLGRIVGLGEAAMAAVLAGRAPPDPRLAALAEFTRAVLAGRGDVSDAEFARFRAAGFTPRHALDVVLGVALKTLTNFASRLTRVPLDAP